MLLQKLGAVFSQFWINPCSGSSQPHQTAASTTQAAARSMEGSLRTDPYFSSKQCRWEHPQASHVSCTPRWTNCTTLRYCILFSHTSVRRELIAIQRVRVYTLSMRLKNETQTVHQSTIFPCTARCGLQLPQWKINNGIVVPRAVKKSRIRNSLTPIVMRGPLYSDPKAPSPLTLTKNLPLPRPPPKDFHLAINSLQARLFL